MTIVGKAVKQIVSLKQYFDQIPPVSRDYFMLSAVCVSELWMPGTAISKKITQLGKT